ALAIGVLLWLLAVGALGTSRALFENRGAAERRRNLVALIAAVAVLAAICALVSRVATSVVVLQLIIVAGVFACPMFLLVGISVYGKRDFSDRISVFWRVVLFSIGSLMEWPVATLLIESRGRAPEFYGPLAVFVALLFYMAARGAVPKFLMERL